MTRALSYLVLILMSVPSFACISIEWTVKEVMQDSTLIVFYGKALNTDGYGEKLDNSNNPLITEFKILRAWKGNFLRNRVSVYQTNDCYSIFEDDKYYLVVGYMLNTNIETHDGFGEQVKNGNHPKLLQLETDYNEIEVGRFISKSMITIIVFGAVVMGSVFYGIQQRQRRVD